MRVMHNGTVSILTVLIVQFREHWKDQLINWIVKSICSKLSWVENVNSLTFCSLIVISLMLTFSTECTDFKFSKQFTIFSIIAVAKNSSVLSLNFLLWLLKVTQTYTTILIKIYFSQSLALHCTLDSSLHSQDNINC